MQDATYNLGGANGISRIGEATNPFSVQDRVMHRVLHTQGSVLALQSPFKVKILWDHEGPKWDVVLVGDVAKLNGNGQADLGYTNHWVPNHEFASAHELFCTNCGFHYGANSCDAHLRKCPRCDDGQPSLDRAD